MRIAAILLAAGEGRRIGGPKALLPIRGTTFLDHLCRLFADGGVDLTIAVLGAFAERVRREGRIPQGVSVVVNERWPEGMLSSVWRGLDEAEALGADAVLLHPVDHPLLEAATVARLRQALLGGAAIAVPAWEGRRGHPGAFASRLFPALRAAAAGVGARAVLAAHAGSVVHVPGDAGCVAGVDFPRDLERLGAASEGADHG